MKRTLIWIAALLLGALLGSLGLSGLNAVMDFLATVYTRLFQLLAVPTIVLAVVTTLMRFGSERSTGRIFGRTVTYTLLTTLVAAATGAVLFMVFLGSSVDGLNVANAEYVAPSSGSGEGTTSFTQHLLSVVPNNVVRPLLEGNVLSLLLLALAVGLALSRMRDSEGKAVLTKGIQGLQELLFILIGWLVWALPLGIVAFSAQLAAQLHEGMAMASLGRYVGVILGGNLIQFFVVLPLFLLARGLNPLHVLARMSPAVLMALFTKSSAATLPVTMQSAEQRLGVSPRVARFVLPICTTINMNGCAAFITVTSLFVMQQSGVPITLGTAVLWTLLAVVCAIGNAGVPMGCYFLTMSLMTGIGANVAVMGLILPVYAIIDMVETAENVWSDSCVCAMTDRDL